MRAVVAKWMQECEFCQKNNTLVMSLAGLLQPFALPNQVWEELTMDFIEGLPK